MTRPLCAVRIAASLAKVAPEAWDACANPYGEKGYNPFVSHAFLRALELSGSVGAGTGWTPAYALAEDAAGRLVAAAPAYLKAHSLGEYVFDQGFAEAYARAGGRYYPKLQIAVPFTPVAGPRLLVSRDAPEGAREALIAALRALRDDMGASSIHVAFAAPEDMRALTAAGFVPRLGAQYHFFNAGYRDYADFLDALTSHKRKTLRRERREALAGGVDVEWLTGDALRPAHWDAFFAFYMDTGARKWGRPYLTRAFFDLIGAAMPERILLVMARREGRYIAGALNFLGDDAVYGRWWGALEARPFLHFELCYHQAVDYAIRHGCKRVEAGAQGEHKIARGYRPAAVQSAHEFAHAGFHAVAAAYLARERVAVAAGMAADAELLPFRRERS